jgi:hypothetical protein
MERQIMIVISTYGKEIVSESDMSQMRSMWRGLVGEYRTLLLQADKSATEMERGWWEMEAHECRTIALRISTLLDMDIREAQEQLAPLKVKNE